MVADPDALGGHIVGSDGIDDGEPQNGWMGTLMVVRHVAVVDLPTPLIDLFEERVSESIKGSLLSTPRNAWRRGCLELQRAVHSLVSSVLLWFPGLDALVTNTQLEVRAPHSVRLVAVRQRLIARRRPPPARLLTR